MATKDTNKKPFLEDNDSNVSIGIDLPIRLDNSASGSGYFGTTQTPIEAVKNNIRNLLNTQQGERLMQPTFGMNLRRLLFEPLSEGAEGEIQHEIVQTFQLWLPFVQVQNIIVSSPDISAGGTNAELRVSIDFNIKSDPNTLESVQVEISSNLSEDTQQTAGGGTY